MTDSTRAILSLLAESGVALSKRGVEINLRLRDNELSYSTIKNHLRLAEATGLVEIAEGEGTWYKITDEGRDFLSEDLDDADLDEE